MDNLTPAQRAEREQCVRSDRGRMRGSHRYRRYDRPVPAAFFRSDTEDFDRRHGLQDVGPVRAATPPRQSAASGEGSSSRVSPLQPRRLDVDDGFPPYDPAAFEGGVAVEDFVPEDILKDVAGYVARRSLSKKNEDRKSRRLDDMDDEERLVLGIAELLRSAQKVEEWDEERAEIEGYFAATLRRN